MSDLTDYLTAVADMRTDNLDGFKYRSYESLLLAEGTTWTDVRVEDHGPARHCYTNAFYAAEEHGWKYVEGFAMSVIPMPHAWCLDSDQVVETTWDDAGAEYRGIVLPLAYVSEAVSATGYWGVMPNEYMDGMKLLRDGGP